MRKTGPLKLSVGRYISGVVVSNWVGARCRENKNTSRPGSKSKFEKQFWTWCPQERHDPRENRAGVSFLFVSSHLDGVQTLFRDEAEPVDIDCILHVVFSPDPCAPFQFSGENDGVRQVYAATSTQSNHARVVHILCGLCHRTADPARRAVYVSPRWQFSCERVTVNTAGRYALFGAVFLCYL